MSAHDTRAGELCRALLYRFWEPGDQGTVLPSPRELATIAPCLLAKGAAALAHVRTRADERLANTEAAQRLRAAYRLYAAAAAAHEARVARSIALVGQAGVTPLLFKGLAAARLYPARGLRPSGDVDLLVPTSAAREVEALLERERAREQVHVDLHATLTPFEATDYDALLARSVAFDVGDVTVHALGPNDALRHACLHWLKHGGERPTWLCDIALIAMHHARELDYARVLGPELRLAAWIAQVLALARDLLGADGGARFEAALAGVALEPWLRRAVLSEWATLRRTREQRAYAFLNVPRRWPDVIADRWPSAIEVAGRASFPDQHPLPAQLSTFAGSVMTFASKPVKAKARRAAYP